MPNKQPQSHDDARHTGARTKKNGPLALLRLLARSLPYERRCMHCATAFRPSLEEKDEVFCPTCSAAMPRRLSGYCPRCGELAAWPGLPVAPCGRCLKTPPPWQDLIFHGAYEGPLRRMLLSLKFGGQAGLGHALGGLLASHPQLPFVKPDFVVPVPLHPQRLKTRGYNQALEIARPLAKRLGVPLYASLLKRVRDTPPQSGFNLEQRQKNILKAFACDQDLAGKRPLLVDDTFTTGATLQAASRTLLTAGATATDIAVVSRTARRWGK